MQGIEGNGKFYKVQTKSTSIVEDTSFFHIIMNLCKHGKAHINITWCSDNYSHIVGEHFLIFHQTILVETNYMLQ